VNKDDLAFCHQYYEAAEDCLWLLWTSSYFRDIIAFVVIAL